MSKRNQFLSRSLDKINLSKFVQRNLNINSPINYPKINKLKFSYDFNKTKDYISINDNNNFIKDKKILTKKSYSIEKVIKKESNKKKTHFNPIKKVFAANYFNENIITDKKIKNKKSNLDTQNDVLPIIKNHVNENYFNKQYKRTYLHSNSTKVDKNALSTEINKILRESNNHSKFFSGKKEDSHPTILSPIINYNGIQNKKFTFTDLCTKKTKDSLNVNDLDNSSKEGGEVEEQINLGNISSDENLENNGREKKLIVKTKFKISDKKSSFDSSENNDEFNKKFRKESFNSFNIENHNNFKIKLKFEDDDENIYNENKNQEKITRRIEYRHTVQPNQTPRLNQQIILSSVLTKPGIFEDKEKINQDSYLIKENIFAENFNIYGIFDGHGDEGHLISNYISKFFNNYYTNELNYIFKENELLSKINNKNKVFLEENEKIIRNSQIELDTKLEGANINISQSGSTSVLLFLINDTLICANIGDSECYLFNCSEEDKWSFESLSKIHKPNDEKEKKRILEKGGEVHPYYNEDGIFEGPDRIYEKNKPFPGLSLSRSIGDLVGKKIGVISEPDIVTKKIDGNSKFIVMGSDGFWDSIKPYDVSRFVRIYFDKGDIDGACRILMNKALQAWKRKNIERDDITIIVIFIGKPNILIQKDNNNLLNIIKENKNDEKDNSLNEPTYQKPLILKLE